MAQGYSYIPPSLGSIRFVFSNRKIKGLMIQVLPWRTAQFTSSSVRYILCCDEKQVKDL